jgi:hypothetical protein
LSPAKGPAIKFNYGGGSGTSSRPLSPQPQSQYQPQYQPQTIVKSPSKLEQSIKYNSVKEENRLPIFLRRLRELTNSYPNFYSSSTFTPENVQKYNEELKEAF